MFELMCTGPGSKSLASYLALIPLESFATFGVQDMSGGTSTTLSSDCTAKRKRQSALGSQICASAFHTTSQSTIRAASTCSHVRKSDREEDTLAGGARHAS